VEWEGVDLVGGDDHGLTAVLGNKREPKSLRALPGLLLGRVERENNDAGPLEGCEQVSAFGGGSGGVEKRVVDVERGLLSTNGDFG
jgi:hypothetical protein